MNYLISDNLQDKYNFKAVVIQKKSGSKSNCNCTFLFGSDTHSVHIINRSTILAGRKKALEYRLKASIMTVLETVVPLFVFLTRKLF